ncbi:hypothetical protein E4N77_09270 [Treponema denticola]|nr:hypothetical protein E4N77_09270 [Treponema denticola]
MYNASGNLKNSKSLIFFPKNYSIKKFIFEVIYGFFL